MPIKLYLTVLIFTLFLFNCTQKKSNLIEEVVLQYDNSLLETKQFTSNGFSFKTPLKWIKVTADSSAHQLFLDQNDSSTMIVNSQLPDVSNFIEPQVSFFKHNKVSFEQSVYQNNIMIMFALKMKSTNDSLNIIYATPRRNVENQMRYIESSIGSIFHKNN